MINNIIKNISLKVWSKNLFLFISMASTTRPPLCSLDLSGGIRSWTINQYPNVFMVLNMIITLCMKSTVKLKWLLFAWDVKVFWHLLFNSKELWHLSTDVSNHNVFTQIIFLNSDYSSQEETSEVNKHINCSDGANGGCSHNCNWILVRKKQLSIMKRIISIKNAF